MCFSCGYCRVSLFPGMCSPTPALFGACFVNRLEFGVCQNNNNNNNNNNHNDTQDNTSSD